MPATARQAPDEFARGRARPLLDAAERALSADDVDAATALVDRAALLPRDGLQQARFELVEGRLAVLAGRVRPAEALFEGAAASADRLRDAGAKDVADAARLEMFQMALRSGNVRRAASIAAQLTAIDGTRRRLVDAAVRIGRGDRVGIEDLDAEADALLVRDGPSAGVFLADTVGLALVWGEHYDAADRLLGRLSRGARAAKAVGPLASLLGVHSLADLRTNRYRMAAAHADEAVRLADSTGRPGIAALPLTVLAVAEAVRGNVEGCRAAATRLAEDGARSSRSGSRLSAEVASRAAMGLLHLGLGEADLAVAQLEPLVGRAETAPWLVMWQMDLAEALIRVGRSSCAEHVLEDFLTEVGHVGSGRVPAVAARVRALLLGDDPDQALELLAHAEALLRDTDNPFGLARTLLVRGTLQRRWGNDAAGRADLGIAEMLFDGLGAEGWAAQAAGECVRGQVPDRAIPRPNPLTPQELQVAGLVATGRSNREVAETLFISVRTVESHLGRIYRKLDVGSRSQLIARADEWGLRDQQSW